MSRNWYIIYTINQREKKVATVLNQKKIINYLAFNTIIPPDSLNSKAIKKSLFKSQLFVYILADEISQVKQIPGIINFLYWLDKPAVIQQQEIEAIKQITSKYSNIKLVRSAVKLFQEVSIVEETVFSSKMNLDRNDSKIVEITLPSLGYTMIAEKEAIQPLILKKELIDTNQYSHYVHAIN